MTKNPKKPGQIIICRANEMLKKAGQLKPAAVLSIEHPGVLPGEHGAAPRLGDGTPQLVLSFWDSETPVQDGPDIAQIEQGIAFVMEHILEGDVIIHCNAGVSRSAAVALGVLSLLHPGKDEARLIELLLEIRPIAAPNIIVVGMVDELTGRDGKLLQAVKDHKDITQARRHAEIGRSGWLKRHPETYRKMHPEKFPPPPGL